MRPMVARAKVADGSESSNSGGRRLARAARLLTCTAALSLGAAGAAGLAGGCAGEPSLRSRLRASAAGRAQARANVETTAEKDCPVNAWRCAETGYHYFLGADVPRDEIRARAMFERGCEAGDERACPFLGYALLTGRGGPRDEARGLSLLHDGCKAGNANGYGYLGVAHEDGLGGLPRDPELAARYYLVGCGGGGFLYGSRMACARLGAMVQEGRGVEQSDYWAGYLFEAACSVEDPDAARLSCLRGAALFERGGFPPGLFHEPYRELPRSYPEVALEMRRRGCEAGLAEACQSLEAE